MKLLLLLLLITPAITASVEDTSGEPGTEEELKESAADSKMVERMTAFSMKLFQSETSMSPPGRNVIIPTFGISCALATASLGARAETRQEILDALGLSSTEEEAQIHGTCSRNLQKLNEPAPGLRLSIGYTFFVDGTFTLLGGFHGDAQRLHRSNVVPIDFTDPRGAIEKINKYMADKTGGEIEEPLQSIDPDTGMVLATYFNFKGEWKNAFDQTTVEKFFVDESTAVEVPMMHRSGRYSTFQDAQLPCTVVELPYQESKSMFIIVPEPGKIHEVEQGLSAETMQRWRSSLYSRFIILSLPKFSMSTTMGLKEALSPLGIVTPFSDDADFSGITDDIGLKLGNLFHTAALSVDENGSVTAPSPMLDIDPLRLPQPIEVKADHPFIVMTFDHHTNSILCMGTVMDPTKK